MKINNRQAIINAVQAEWVEIEELEFFYAKKGTDKTLLLSIKEICLKEDKPIAMYCYTDKKYYAEQSIYEAMQPKRKEGWYRAVMEEARPYSSKKIVVYYMEHTGNFYCGKHCISESNLEWIDDNPIEFPGE